MEFDHYDQDDQYHDSTEDLKKLCLKNNGEFSHNPKRGLHCPRSFDGWLCWNETRAGTTATQDCTNYLPGSEPGNFARKECLSDGTWYENYSGEYTDYSNCFYSYVTSEYNAMNTPWWEIIYGVLYLSSLGSLVIALIVFCSFKTLDSTQIRVHKNFIASWLIGGILWIIFDALLKFDIALAIHPSENIWVAMLVVGQEYIELVNYFWLFCEGFYIYALATNKTAKVGVDIGLLFAFALFAWIGPIVPVGAEKLCRFFSNSAMFNLNGDSQCKWFTAGPILGTLVCVWAILIYALIKLPSPTKENQQVQANPKAIFTVTLLLGCNYIFSLITREIGSEKLYAISNLLTVSQGLIVSILLCFGNPDVISAFGKLCSRGKMEFNDNENEDVESKVPLIKRQSSVDKSQQ